MSRSIEYIRFFKPLPVYLYRKFPYVRVETGTLAAIHEKEGHPIGFKSFPVWDSPYTGQFGEIGEEKGTQSRTFLCSQEEEVQLPLINDLISYIFKHEETFNHEDISMLFKALKKADVTVCYPKGDVVVPVHVDVKGIKNLQYTIWTFGGRNNLWIETDFGSQEDNIKDCLSLCSTYRELPGINTIRLVLEKTDGEDKHNTSKLQLLEAVNNALKESELSDGAPI